MSRSRVKTDELQLARVVRQDAIAKVHAAHGSESNYALAVSNVKKTDGPQLERIATDALRGLGQSLDTALKGFDPATNSNPTLTVHGHAGSETFNPSAFWHWDDLENSTLLRKTGGKVNYQAVASRKRAALQAQSKRRFWFRIWRNRKNPDNGFYSKLRAPLAAMRRAKVSFVEVGRTPVNTRTSTGAKFGFRYALVFPRGRGEAGALLDGLALNFLLQAQLFGRGGIIRDPPGFDDLGANVSTTSIRALLYPERARPLIRPMAMAAGRRLDAQLRRLRK